MDPRAQAVATKRFTYGDGDPDALVAMKAKVAVAGRRRDPLTYERLVDGVLFRLPNSVSVGQTSSRCKR